MSREFLDPGQLAVICVLGGPFLVAALAIVSKSVERAFRHSRDVSLKMRLADAGMSADEIERVVRAQAGDRAASGKSIDAGFATHKS